MTNDIPELIADAEETGDALIEAALSTEGTFIMNKIHHVLSMYPKISPTMLQMGIGPSISPQMWRPVYELMVKEKMLIETQVSAVAPTGRSQSYRIVEQGENFARAATKH